MGKFNVSTGGGPSQISDLQEQAAVQLPAGEAQVEQQVQEEAPQPTALPTPQPGQSNFDALLEQQKSSETPGQVLEQTPRSQEETAQLQQDIGAGVDEAISRPDDGRFDVPNITQRKTDDSVKQWLLPKTDPSANSIAPDGGMMGRASNLSKSMQQGKVAPAMKLMGEQHALQQAGATSPEIAASFAAEQDGNIAAALHRIDAVTKNDLGSDIPNAQFAAVGSAVVENMMADAAFNSDDANTENEFEFDTGEADEFRAGTVKQPGKSAPIKKAQGNAHIGQQIYQEYQRLQGVKVPERASQKEAEALGDTFKLMWALENPSLVEVSKDLGDGTRQGGYRLTAQGERALADGKAFRGKLFPKINVRPSKFKPEGGKLPGDVGANVAKQELGKVGKGNVSSGLYGKKIPEAMENLSTVGNMVHERSAMVMLATVLPVLASGDHTTWMAEINNMGPSKLNKFAGKAQQDQARVEAERAKGNQADLEYDPDENMRALTNKIAQEVRSVAMEKDGVNYLTYSVQGYNGRISPQQSVFDPTTSKLVRAVTSNPVKSYIDTKNKKERVHRNLRQMYAMMLVGDHHKVKEFGVPGKEGKFIKADALLPDAREIALTAASPKLEQWGLRLKEAMAGWNKDTYDAVTKAIADGTPLSDPNFPQVPPIALDQQQDAELISAIEGKGEDGIAFMDGLMDFADYSEAVRTGSSFGTNFTAVMDGKTNGLATNGMQLGLLEMAGKTGVTRKNAIQLLDEGDLRDAIADINVKSLSQEWEGPMNEIASEMDDIAEQIFRHRDLNKHTTMTYGYGKEIDSFKGAIEESLALLQAERANDPSDSFNQSLKVALDRYPMDVIAKSLMDRYAFGLNEVMSSESKMSRQAMRAAAAIHAATNTIFEIQSPVGQTLRFGKNQSLGYDLAEKQKQRIYGSSVNDGAKPRQFETPHYETEATSAAAKPFTDPETGEKKAVPGQYAWGGSIPGPVQSVDAATVALTASGPSWSKLKQASKGNPYLHTIYDAFKTDANGYDVVLDEVNNNWVKASTEWSYLKETKKSIENAREAFREKMKGRNDNDPITENEAAYMKHMLTLQQNDKGNLVLKDYIKMITKLNDYKKDQDFFDDINLMKGAMKAVGYDVDRPPAEPTVKQLKQFIATLNKTVNPMQKLDKIINVAEANKKELKREIQRRGPVYQYYAH